MTSLTQGVVAFQYAAETKSSGSTGLAGLGAYLDLAEVSGLWSSIDRHVGVREGRQGWSDRQLIGALVLLNLAGGECVEDIEHLEADEGLCRLWRRVERRGLSAQQRVEAAARFRRPRQRTFAAPATLLRYLGECGDAQQEAPRPEGRAWVPKPSSALAGLGRVGAHLLAFAQRQSLERVATLDQDATLIETAKREALWSYQGTRAYQPQQVWWAEQELVVHSEFRDGNVPAGFEQLRVLREALARLPAGVEQVRLRSDAAGYQHELLEFCDAGLDERFGRIEFAVGCPMSPELRAAVAQIDESAWQPLGGDQQWAEACFVPNAIAHCRHGREYRYLVVREPLRQLDLPGVAVAPDCPVVTTAAGSYRVRAVVSNRAEPGAEIIAWYRQRCGKSEEVHAVLKEDFAGGKLPSGRFGVNAAWWAIVVLALNLNQLMKRFGLGHGWRKRRMKAVRFHLICLPGRVVEHARQLVVRLSRGRTLAALLSVRQRLRSLTPLPAS